MKNKRAIILRIQSYVYEFVAHSVYWLYRGSILGRVRDVFLLPTASRPTRGGGVTQPLRQCGIFPTG